ncbi:hypothetical protein D3W54_12820 [Komagataeibacter medellinensis]|uniref:Transposase n=1 Tax=Komagataeibacter medellinensis TaxID=1177712 RepID=A0ABQ6VY24_9PROT|nr:hypothetical protein D3W54_12820 [Komagataeibacter medellinensis]
MEGLEEVFLPVARGLHHVFPAYVGMNRITRVGGASRRTSFDPSHKGTSFGRENITVVSDTRWLTLADTKEGFHHDVPFHFRECSPHMRGGTAERFR